MKEKAKKFLGEQYEEFVPPRAKRLGKSLRNREPQARQTLKVRGERGKQHLKKIVGGVLTGIKTQKRRKK